MKNFISRGQISSNDLSLLLGLAISAPFMEALVPAKGITLLLSFCFMLASVKSRQVTFSVVAARIKFSYYFMLLFAVYVVSILLTPFYLKSNIFFLAQFLSIYALFLFSPKEIDYTKLWRGFFSAFLPLTVVVAVLGIVKAFLLERGYFLEPLYMLYSFFNIEYPWGSSIRPDYNLFSIAILCCAFFVLRKDVLLNVNKYIYSIAVGVLLLCSYYSTSRRGFLFMAVLPLILILYEQCLKGLVVKKTIKKLFISIVIGGFLYLSGVIVLTGVQYNSYKLWPNLSESPPIKWRHIGTVAAVPFPEWLEEIIKEFRAARTEIGADEVYLESYSDVTEKLESYGYATDKISFESRSYVTGERIVRWKFAWEMLKASYFVLPMGFSYQMKFGCRFEECKTKDYPHNVFLSEWLVAGILSLGLCLWVFIRHAMNLYSLKNVEMKMKLVVLSFFTFPNLLISGDYLFTSGMSVAVLVLSLALSCEQKQSEA